MFSKNPLYLAGLAILVSPAEFEYWPESVIAPSRPASISRPWLKREFPLAKPRLPNPLTLLEQCEKNFAGVRDYTALIVKRQRIEGNLRKPETIFMKFKKPHSIYLKWVKDPGKGKEVIYVDGKNDNKLVAHPGGFLSKISPTLHLDPTHPLAMGENVKPITQAGMGFAIQSLLKACRSAAAAGELVLACKGIIPFEGRKVFVVERRLPAEDKQKRARAVVYIDAEHNLPVYFASYDKGDQLLEEYKCRNLQLNVGLTDRDFDAGNPEYDFASNVVRLL